jgi:predicted GIY-YIG superfamily endonuclease
MPYFIYILELRDGHLYVGSTDDLARRLQEHKEGRGSRTTRIGKLRKFLYSEEHATRQLAEQRERQLKGWSRAKKLALAHGDQSRLHQLAKRVV